MSDTISIVITAKDGASRTFEAVVDAAEELKPALDRATGAANKLEPAAQSAVEAIKPLDKEMKEAGKAAEESSRAIEKSAKSLGSYKDAADKAGKGLALLGGAFTVYANQARDHEINVMALNRIYGEAADSYLELADRIQGTTIFSNDQAIEAARLMGTLRENYDLTDVQIQKLIQTSADLAAMHGMTLTDAAMRVQSAIRGEAESAEALGLTMNQAAIDTQGLTLSMSNAEAAQFRFNAMMQQTASSVGFAAEAADNNTGKVIRLANETQDAAIAFIRFTGPVGDAAAGLSQFGIQGGAAALGLIQLGRGISAAAAAAGGMTALLGPAGLIVLGLSAAAVAAKLFADSMRDEAAEAMKSARLEAEQLDATISGITSNLTGIDFNFRSAIIGSDDALDELQHNLDYWQYLIDTWADFPRDRLNLSAETIAGLDEEVRASIESQRLAIAYMEQYAAELGSVEDAAGKLAEAERDLNSLLTHRGAGREEILAELAELVDSYRRGEISIMEYIAAIDALEKRKFEIDNDVILDQLHQEQQAVAETTQAWIDYEQAMNQAALASVANAQAIHLQRTALQELNGALQLLPSGEEGYGDRFDVGPFARRYASMGQTAIDATKLAMDAMVLTIGGGESAWNKYAGALGVVTRETETLNEEVVQLTADIKGDLGVSIEDLNDSFQSAMRAASGLSDTLYDLRAQGGTVGLDLAINTGSASQALQSGFSAIVGGSNSLGSIAQQTADWSGSLAHAAEGLAADQTTLNDLLQKGAITQTTYNRALDANHRIQQANISVQEDVLRIQAKQLPVMAELAEQHARYVDELADADVATQTVALGYMDQTKAAQAMGLANLAASASMAGMNDVAGEMIIKMAEADPILKAMLIDMKLISEEDGVIKFNADQVTSTSEALTTLNSTIGTLNSLIAEAFNIDLKLDDDGAERRLGMIYALLNQLDGKSVTTYATVQTLNVGSLAGAGANARNGGVIGYANGGMVMAELGEVGSELVRLANGGVALAPTRGLYMVERGSNVMPAEATKAELARRRRDSGGGDTYIYSGQVTQRVTYEESSFARRRDKLAGERR